MKRVVITGAGVISPLGIGVEAMMSGLAAGRSAVQRMTDWSGYKGLQALTGAPAPLENANAIPRSSRRFMGRLSLFAAQAADQAVAQAGLDPEFLGSGAVGAVVGSTMGSAASISEAFEIMLPDHDLTLLPSTSFFQSISHTAAMNVSQYLNIRGVVLATAAACASGLQAIGAGFDLVRNGRQTCMLCGGAEELHPTVTASFDIIYAASTEYNDQPQCSSRPFDTDRDGLVCGEGAGVVVLEEYEHAKARGAEILGEIVGYHTCGNGSHITQSDTNAMVACMHRAMADAAVETADIDFVSAHATATVHGDPAEAQAIRAIFGDRVPVNSLKGHLGHTLGASGAIELVAGLEAMRTGEVYATRNLENVDPECDGIDHVRETRKLDIDVLLKNCFAFGGINAALVCRQAE